MRNEIIPLVDLPGYPDLLTPRQTCEMTGIPASTLATARSEGRGFPFVKIGKTVRYRKADILDYINRHTFRSTAEAQQVGGEF